MNSNKEKYYQWFIGLLIGLLLLFGGAALDNIIRVGPIEDRIEEHISLPSHPVSEAERKEIVRRLDRMERKQDQILQSLNQITARNYNVDRP